MNIYYTVHTCLSVRNYGKKQFWVSVRSIIVREMYDTPSMMLPSRVGRMFCVRYNCEGVIATHVDMLLYGLEYFG